MKKAAVFVILCLNGIYLFAQLVPVQNSVKEIVEHKVKSSATYCSNVNEKERLVFQKKFDTQGKLLEKYQLFMWDVVSYQYTTTYKYNEEGFISEEFSFQEFLELDQRDKDYLRTFGDKPLNEKKLYFYNEQGQLSAKTIYLFGENGLEPKSSTNQSIIYQYENDLLVYEESTSSDDKFFNKNYLIKYSYDSADNVIQKSMAYGTEKELQRNYIFHYNHDGHLIEEQVIDTSIPHNNNHLKYEYNDQGLIKNKYIFNDIEQEFELETSYQYDAKGNAISGDRDVKFEYYENELIKSESWTDPISDQKFTFITKYEYY